MQLSIDLPIQMPKEAYDYGRRASGEAHGVVLTKPHVVEFILDLAGYVTGRDLTKMRFLDPACGHGAFLEPAVTRVLQVAQSRGVPEAHLKQAILAFDVDPEHVTKARAAVARILRQHGVVSSTIEVLARRWVVEGDFLLARIEGDFDAVVGNPPYVRTEQIAPELQAEYRARYTSLFDRADLYVAFIERGLRLLNPKGILSFVCADRWTLNRYGAPLRELVAEGFATRCYVDLHQASPFESDVIAYPAVFSIGREPVSRVAVVHLNSATGEDLSRISVEIAAADRCAGGGGTTQESTGGENTVQYYDTWFSGNEPWTLSSPSQLRLLRDLERRFEPIQNSGQTKVGIGVATGNDSVYIVADDVDVERDRLVPLVMREDITQGRIRDARRFVINTFEDGAGVVDLAKFPRLARYFNQHVKVIKGRHVAQSRPDAWFRTIDRVYPELVRTPKLLIPDIAGANEVAFDEGRFHPHHNLYFVTSNEWDLEVLGGLISSRVALFFVWSYAVKMRGGYLRFQAQYLRRIRLPRLESLSAALRSGLRDAFRARDFQRIDVLALKAYDLKTQPEFDFVDTRGRR